MDTRECFIAKQQTCFICNEKTNFLGSSGHYKISVCPQCGLGITNNPNLQISKYHRDNEYEQESDQFKNIFQRRVNIINSLGIKPGKALEIGSSTGLLLSLLKENGWDVNGVEISPQAAEFAEKRGVKTIHTPVEKLTLPAGTFDLVILNHTLEHLQNPKEVLEKLHDLLIDDGVLLIDVPNFGSLSARIFKTSWFALLPEEHYWHFTFNSLSRLLHSSGFKVLKRTSPSGIWDYGNPLAEVVQSFIGFKKRFFMNIFTSLPNLIVTLINQGATLTVVAKKVN